VDRFVWARDSESLFHSFRRFEIGAVGEWCDAFDPKWVLFKPQKSAAGVPAADFKFLLLRFLRPGGQANSVVLLRLFL
jgi:hypothetical protein